MIHTKLAHCHTWGYHAIKARYFSMALNNYYCIKAVTDTGLNVDRITKRNETSRTYHQWKSPHAPR
ncbi:hypothetical protein ACHAW6_003126 [Cyclotella cf. meneghiniana]